MLETHTGGMEISLDGQANDGHRREGDNIAADFELIDGTDASDVFPGSPGGDHFPAGPGDDEIHGGDGADNLAGGAGDDRVYGERATTTRGHLGRRPRRRRTGQGPALRRHRLLLAVLQRSTPTSCSRATVSATSSTAAAAPTRRRSTSLTSSRSALTVDRQRAAVAGAFRLPPGPPSPLTVAKSVKLARLLKKGLSFR